jgi:hypothetical protein
VFVFDRLVDSSDDFIVSPNNDTIYLRAFLDLRAEPIVSLDPADGRPEVLGAVSDMWHDHDANLSFDTVGSQGGAFALVAPGWQGRAAGGRQAGRHEHAARLAPCPASSWLATRIFLRPSSCRRASSSSR